MAKPSPSPVLNLGCRSSSSNGLEKRVSKSLCLVSPLKPPNSQECLVYKDIIINRLHLHDNENFGKVCLLRTFWSFQHVHGIDPRLIIKQDLHEHMNKSQAHIVTSLGHLSVPILAILFTGGKPGGGGSVMGKKRVDTWDARGQFTNWTRWDRGGDHVALCTAITQTLIQLGSSTHVCWVEAKQRRVLIYKVVVHRT